MVIETGTRKVNLRLNMNVDKAGYATRSRSSMNSAASGSVFQGDDVDDGGSPSPEEDEDADGIIDGEEDGDESIGARTRRAAKKKGAKKGKAVKKEKIEYAEDEFENYEEAHPRPEPVEIYTRSGRAVRTTKTWVESSENDDEDHRLPAAARGRIRRRKDNKNVIESDENGEVSVRRSTRNLRSRSSNSGGSENQTTKVESQSEQRAKRARLRSARSVEEAADFDPDAEGEEDAEGENDMDLDVDGAHTDPEDRLPPTERRPRRTGAREVGVDPSGLEKEGYSFRKRAKVNYAIPPPIEDLPPPSHYPQPPRRNTKGKIKKPGWNLRGDELSRYLGLPGVDDSDSDAQGRSPRKRPGVPTAAAGAGGLLPAAGTTNAADAGGPANYGRLPTGKQSLADTDPLGVPQNISFDSVGGLDEHITSLKEMTLLPLLYPELFTRFNITPPRGVLFHGPPGTGKTLVARALAASCRGENGREVAFFMRKGADVLSKWVGEAERQLRMLFEEARRCQPSIIFFDEIDGLAPVRSSKQDQIHASIVSTLLALMDGMDNRGQVIIIGATNRPDAIDSALRRPGRFDREFYFPLPSLTARLAILRIHTKSWEGWEENNERGEKLRERLATVTKGFGGADIRSLCTEAALESVKRVFPQIWRSEQRLLLDPGKVIVEGRDFWGVIKKMVPSSARSSSSTASPLPTQLVPLLNEPLEHSKSVLSRLLPDHSAKKRSSLEEAEYEWASPPGDEDGGLEKEILMQRLDTLRVYRPRLVLSGKQGGGNGMNYVGAALLDWLEGFHVQSLELGGLMADSTRTIEASIVQLFIEAKRHQPSVLYIPSLIGWCAALSEQSRATVKAMLDTLSPTDPVLLLAIVDGPFNLLPRDVRGWFGMPRSDNRIDFSQFAPKCEQRREFFADLIKDVRRKPSHWPDGWKRRKRILEELPIAPPLAPRPPSETELAAQLEADTRTLSVLKYRLGPVLNDLKRKFKVFCKKAHEDYGFDEQTRQLIPLQTVQPPDAGMHGIFPESPTRQNGIVVVPDEAPIEFESPIQQPQQQQEQLQMEPEPEQPPDKPREIKFHNMDLERMHEELYHDKYLSLDEFLNDIKKIVANVFLAYEAGLSQADNERRFKAQALMTTAQVHYHDFDPNFRVECENMAVRERKRREEKRQEEEKKLEEEREKERELEREANAVRRSNRANGLAPEHRIQDIGKIERALKRARSSEGNTPRETSEDENRENKRSRMSEDGGAADVGMPAINEEPSETVDQVGQPPLLHPHEHLEASTSAIPPVPSFQMASETQEMFHPLQATSAQPFQTPLQAPHSQSSAMSVSALLNDAPISSIPQVPTPSPNFPSWNMTYSNMPMFPQMTPTGPQSSLAPPFNPHDIIVPRDQLPAFTPVAAPRTAEISTSTAPAVPEAFAVEPPPSVPELSHIEEPRRPSTPPPDFVLDEQRLSDFEWSLSNDTSRLNVEQLEQLRATALGAVWRERTKWDKSNLLRELQGLVYDFLEDVRAEEVETRTEGDMNY